MFKIPKIAAAVSFEIINLLPVADAFPELLILDLIGLALKTWSLGPGQSLHRQECRNRIPWGIGLRFGENNGILGLGSNIGHGLFVGWVEHTDILCWISFLKPTYVTAIFLLSAKPNKMAEDRTVTKFWNIEFGEMRSVIK